MRRVRSLASGCFGEERDEIGRKSDELIGRIGGDIVRKNTLQLCKFCVTIVIWETVNARY